MGGFKNQLIESQVELGDRIPAPKPWTYHTAVSRKSLREQDRAFKRLVKREMRDMAVFFALGLALGVTVMILIGLV